MFKRKRFEDKSIEEIVQDADRKEKILYDFSGNFIIGICIFIIALLIYRGWGILLLLLCLFVAAMFGLGKVTQKIYSWVMYGK